MKCESGTALLFVIFNRPELTERTFAAIRRARPQRLYVHADGSRASRSGEEALCAAARDVTENVDWPCEVKRLYRDQNLGCGPAVSGALDWFFSEVEEGIVLEDDCLPEPGFFEFAGQMLDRYRHDERVMHISGMGFEATGLRHGAGVFFAPMPFIWGWASWRRAWRHYRYELPSEEQVEEVLRRECPSRAMRDYWRRKFEATRSGEIRTWDYQWVYALWQRGGWAVTPTRSFITNIGFGTESTHTKASIDGFTALVAQATPAEVTVDEGADRPRLAKAIFGEIFTPPRPEFGVEWIFRHPPWLWRLFLGVRRRLRDIVKPLSGA